MSRPGAARTVLALLAGVVACGGEGGPSRPSPPQPGAPPSPTPPPRPTPIPGAPHSSDGVFSATVLVDAQAPQTPRQDVIRVFERAAATLAEKTGEWMWMTDAVYGLARGSSVSQMARSYAAATAANPPDGLVILTNDQSARNFGGYSFWFAPPFAFQNEYPSPRAGVGSDKMYVAVVDFDHPYARCGYDDQGNRVSDVSVGGECRNRPGTPCVRRQSGWAEWTCADAVSDLYADHDYFTACSIIHEFLHPFGIDANANFDHHGTPACIARGGVTQAQAGDSRQAQLNCGLCPDLYPRFARRR